MTKLTIAGQGSVLYMKDNDQESYKEAYLFLKDIYKVSIKGKETGYEIIEMPDIINYLGYSHGRTNLKWICNEGTDELFDIGVEYILPETEHYKILIQHTNAGELLGHIYLIDIVNVNGEDILTLDRVVPEGDSYSESIL